jgi:phosphomevalonate kinase
MLGSHIFQRKNITEDFTQRRKINEKSDRYSYIINQMNSHRFFSFITDYFDSYINKIKYVKFPENFKACLISIESGSDTRIFVSKVLQWAEANKNKELFDTKIFQEINDINEKIIKIIGENSFYLTDTVDHIRTLNIELRKCLKLLSNFSGVEIQPMIMTKLLDSLEANGIVFSICPGGDRLIYK